MAEHPEVEVESYEMRPNVGLFINGERFPYYVLADGPMVEPMPDLNLHILWLPLICQGAIPPQGRPDGEPLREPAPEPEASDGEATRLSPPPKQATPAKERHVSEFVRAADGCVLRTTCKTCGEFEVYPDKGMGRAFAAAWESRHRHDEETA